MKSLTMPTYKKIALDIANNINQELIKEGDLLYGRSVLASKYNVSPETIRRAIILLEDLEVVKTLKGRGIVVLSKEKSILFLSRNQSVDNVRKLKSDLNSLFDKRREIEDEILSSISGIIDYTSRFKEINDIVPLEFVIQNDCVHINKTVADIMFWQNTGATIIAIKREGRLLLSPGPYIVIHPGDILVVIGDDSINSSVPDFLSQGCHL